MSRLAAVIVLSFSVAVVACGGEDPNPAPNPLPEAGGTWSGIATVAPVEAPAWAYEEGLVVTSTSTGATLAGICPLGAGVVNTTGGNGHGEWTGEVFCAIPTKDCPDSTIHYTKLVFDVLDGQMDGRKAMLVVLSGDMVSCTARRSVVTTIAAWTAQAAQ